MKTTRRTILKGSAAAAATAVVVSSLSQSKAKELVRGGSDFSPESNYNRVGVPSACWQCVSRCPIIGYVDEEGKLAKIGGQPNSIRTEGGICAKAQAGISQVYDPDRILHPMVRTGKRGDGEWKRVSWDEALNLLVEGGEIAGSYKKGLRALRDEGHPENFMFHYGRMKASSSKLIKSVFLANYGTKTIGNHTSICEGGKWTAQELTWGSHYDNWDFDNTRFVLNFGSNVLEAHTNHTSVAYRLVRALTERKARMVTFDVRLSNTAAKGDWVPIYPGTDGAVALAMCNVIMSEGLYHGEGEKFLQFTKVTAHHNASLEEKIVALKKHLASYTPEWAERVSGVAADTIRKIAREFATTKPACLISYRGAVAHENGNDTERAMMMLASITGNIDNPGGRCKAVGASWKYPKGPKVKPKARGLKILDGFHGQAALPTHHMSHHVLKVIKDGSQGRPDVYMWYCYQPVYANGDVQENIDILKDETIMPFTVSISPFYDESSELADMILPDATYLERWDWEDMVSPAQIPEWYIRQPIVAPLGGSRDFADVCCEMAERMGFPLGFSSKEEFVKISCEKTFAHVSEMKKDPFGYMKKHGVYHDSHAKPKFYSYGKSIPKSALEADGVIFDEATGVYWNYKKAHVDEEVAHQSGYAHAKSAYKGYVGQLINGQVYSGFKPDKVNKSGYLELYSSIMEEKGLAPMPTYKLIEAHVGLKGNELVLTTYKVNVQSHSRTQNCKWLSEIYHTNPAWINPETALRLGIYEGDTVSVASEIGTIKVKARVTPTVVPGVIAISHHCGHWQYGRYASLKRSPTGQGIDGEEPWWDDNGVHPNWIIPNKPDPINGQQAWMDTVVRVEKAM